MGPTQRVGEDGHIHCPHFSWASALGHRDAHASFADVRQRRMHFYIVFFKDVLDVAAMRKEGHQVLTMGRTIVTLPGADSRLVCTRAMRASVWSGSACQLI